MGKIFERMKISRYAPVYANKKAQKQAEKRPPPPFVLRFPSRNHTPYIYLQGTTADHHTTKKKCSFIQLYL